MSEYKLERVISGFQTGADIGGILAARRFDIPTGGMMPKGFLNQSGPHPEFSEKYGAIEHRTSSKYPPRTAANVQNSDGTIRLAHDFNSRGEKLTLTLIQSIKKPHIDVDLARPRPVSEIVDWLQRHTVKVLNVAGNSESTYSGTTGDVIDYMVQLFLSLGFQEKVETSFERYVFQ
jgi:hypothetical protein